MNDRDDFGWPIRMVNGVRLCAREGCKDEEFRIDGYCSIYCRDQNDAEIEKREIEQAFAAYRADVEPVLRATLSLIESIRCGVAKQASYDHLRQTVAASRECQKLQPHGEEEKPCRVCNGKLTVSSQLGTMNCYQCMGTGKEPEAKP